MIGYLDSFQQDRQRHQERERCRKTKNKASLWTVFYISLFDALFYSRNFISSFLLRGWKSEWWSLGEHLINKTYLGKKCLVLIEVHKFHIFLHYWLAVLAQLCFRTNVSAEADELWMDPIDRQFGSGQWLQSHVYPYGTHAALQSVWNRLLQPFESAGAGFRRVFQLSRDKTLQKSQEFHLRDHRVTSIHDPTTCVRSLRL